MVQVHLGMFNKEITMFNVGDKVYHGGGKYGTGHGYGTVYFIEDDGTVHTQLDNGNRLGCSPNDLELRTKEKTNEYY